MKHNRQIFVLVPLLLLLFALSLRLLYSEARGAATNTNKVAVPPKETPKLQSAEADPYRFNEGGVTLFSLSPGRVLYASGNPIGHFEGTNYVPNPPPGPTFVDGVRICAIIGRRNPDVNILDALVQMCGAVWSAEQQRKGVQP